MTGRSGADGREILDFGAGPAGEADRAGEWQGRPWPWGAPAGWAADLDDDPGATTGDAPAAAAVPGGRGRFALGGVGVLVAVLLGVSMVAPGGPEEARRDEALPEPSRPVPTGPVGGGTAVLRGSLPMPLQLDVPAELTPVSQGRYVGLRAVGATGWVLVSTPEQVVDRSGRRLPLPDDAAAWLRSQPTVFVSRSRMVTVAGREVPQLDYRVGSAASAPSGRFAGVSLFCGRLGSPRDGAPCSRLTGQARVRATFVHVGGRLLLIEAYWREGSSPDGRMPAQLRAGYRQLLADLDLGSLRPHWA
jgi:hypothetical protein